MIRIYLCDDEENVLHQMKTALERKIFMEDYDMEVACAAATARELLDAVQDGGRGIYFLDVDLKDSQWDGFQLGRELRRRDPHGTLVYITGYGDLAWRTFQYHLEAFDYIVKEPGCTGPSAARCLEAVHARLLDERRDPAEMFSLRSGDGTRHIPLTDILFFETAHKAHHVFLHTADSRMDFVGSLGELERELGGRFIRVHRAYLAADKIEVVDWKRNKVRVGGRSVCCPGPGKRNCEKSWVGTCEALPSFLSFRKDSRRLGNLAHGTYGAVVYFPMQTGGRRTVENAMKKEHFVEVYNQGIVNVAWILVDTATGVNYVPTSHNKANGKPVVTPMN